MNKRTQIIIGIVIIIILLIGVAIFVHLSKNIPSVEIPVEIQKPVGEAMKTCLVLDEEYCQKGEVYEFTDEVKAYDREKDDLVFIREETFRDLIFSLPAGVKVYSPMTGFARGYEIITDPQKGISMNIVQLFIPPEEDGRDFLFSGLKLDPFLAGEYQKTGEGVEVKAGQLLGVIDGKTLENLDTSLKDNFTFRIGVTKGNYKIIDEAIAEGDSKKAVEAMRSDNTTLGIFFPYYLK